MNFALLIYFSMASLVYMSKTVSPRYVIPMENLGKKTLIRYGDVQFRLELSHLEVNAKDFLVKFAQKVAPEMSKFPSASACSFRNFQIFNPHTMTYINLNDNLLDYDRVDIANSEFNAEGILQRKITENVTKLVRNKFQFELNRYIKQNQIRTVNGVKNIYNKGVQDKSKILLQEKMIFSSFINNSSDKLASDFVTRIDLSKFNIPDIENQFFIKPKSQNTSVITPESLENMLPVVLTSRSDLEKGFYHTFSILKKLSLIKNSPVEIGVLTNLKRWSFVLFRNEDKKKVEVENDFVISDSYNFEISNVANKKNELYSYFMDIAESIVLEKTKFL